MNYPDEEVRKDLYHLRNHRGADQLIQALEEDTSPPSELNEIVEQIGESCVRQLLGADGEPWLSFWTTSQEENWSEKQSRLYEQIVELWEDGVIADFDYNRIPPRIETDPREGWEDYVEQHRQLRRWARFNDLEVRGFRREDGYVEFPETFLTVRNVYHRLYTLPTEDQDPTGLLGVFPCFDGRTQYTVESYLGSLSEGEGWRNRIEQMGITTPDHGEHGSIKAELAQDPGRTVGEKWTLVEDEESVGYTSASGTGRADLLFEHDETDRYLIVEIKPRSGSVDKAFGQVGRYRHQFLADHADLDLSVEDVEIAIAAPEFRDAHEALADEWGVRLVNVN